MNFYRFDKASKQDNSNYHPSEKRESSLVMQQIETIMELLDELRENNSHGRNNRKQQQNSSSNNNNNNSLHAPGTNKKQIHFSDSSDYYDGEATTNTNVKQQQQQRAERDRKASASLKLPRHVGNNYETTMNNRRQQRNKSIGNSDMLLYESTGIGMSSSSSSSLHGVGASCSGDRINSLLARYTQLKKTMNSY